MKKLIKHILKENSEEKFFNYLINKFGEDFIFKASPNDLRKLEDGEDVSNINSKKLFKLSLTPEELLKLKSFIYQNRIGDKVEEYVEKYGHDPKLAKEKFLKEVIPNLSGKANVGSRTALYNQFLDKLSEFSGQKIERGRSNPEKSSLLLKLSKFIEEPSNVPKSRTEFLKTLGLPRSHFSTTFTRLLRNNLIKSVKKDGKWVYELGYNFDKFIHGIDPEITGDLETLFEDFISEHGVNYSIFYSKFRGLFYKDSDFSKFYKSFKKYVTERRYK